jgi:hypothetical protein
MIIKATNKLLTDLRRLRDKNKFDIAQDGAVFNVGGDLIKAGGAWVIDDGKGWVDRPNNIIVTEGLNYLLDVALGGGTQYATFYTFPFAGNVTPVSTWTAANVTANSTEITAYDEATRVAYVDAAASGGVMTNSASKASFTFNGSGSLYGFCVVSASAKSSTSGVLFSGGRLTSAPKSYADDDVINAAYTVTLTSS